MSEERLFIDYIRDIIDELRRIEKFTENLNYDRFSKDDRTVYAVIRSFEIIGEAVKRIPADITIKYPNIPWKRMSGMRDKLIHDYFGVDTQTLWETIQKRVPETIKSVERMLKDMNK
jgi:uncharacterized protein with HEPN domain